MLYIDAIKYVLSRMFSSFISQDSNINHTNISGICDIEKILTQLTSFPKVSLSLAFLTCPLASCLIDFVCFFFLKVSVEKNLNPQKPFLYPQPYPYPLLIKVNQLRKKRFFSIEAVANLIYWPVSVFVLNKTSV